MNSSLNNRTIFLLACLPALAFGCGHRASDVGRPTEGLQVAAEEKLGVEDVFEVRVFGEPEFSGAYRVAADGTVDYPFAGRLSVLGLSSGEVQELVTKKLQGDYLKKPQGFDHRSRME
jgi:polysaccharide export outer membrane protein